MPEQRPQKADRPNRFRAIKALQLPDAGEANESSVDPPSRSDKQTDIRRDAATKTARANKPGYQKLTVYLPEGLYRQLKVVAAVDARDLYEIADEALQIWLQRRGKTELSG